MTAPEGMTAVAAPACRHHEERSPNSTTARPATRRDIRERHRRADHPAQQAQGRRRRARRRPGRRPGPWTSRSARSPPPPRRRARSGYQAADSPPRSGSQATPSATPRVTRLRGWVEHVYRPGYGHLAAGLADCWDQHPLCLYLLDWLSELWSVLYLRPARTAGTLAGQAEWHTRLLPAAASQLAQETRAAATSSPASAQPAGRGSGHDCRYHARAYGDPVPASEPGNRRGTARVDANGTVWRLRSLVAMGHDCARIARALDVRPELVAASSTAMPARHLGFRAAACRSGTPGGTRHHPPATPAENAPPPERCGSPGSAAGPPPQASTKTNSTRPATGPGAGTAPPPAPAPRRTSRQPSSAPCPPHPGDRVTTNGER